MTDSFLVELSEPRPDPGGGSAAAHGGLLGLALMQKVARLELRRPGISPENESFWSEGFKAIEELVAALALLRQEDTAAYMRMAEGRANGVRGAGLESLMLEAVRVPAAIMEACFKGLELLSRMKEACKAHLSADLRVAAEFLAAAIRGSFHIAIANVALLNDDEDRDEITKHLSSLLRQTEATLWFIGGRPGRSVAEPENNH
jgi:formiminotetrahydrofolate cyclodeaminase